MSDLPCCPWELLTSALVEHIASLLPPNEVFCTLRLINTFTSNLFSAWRRVRLSQLVPHHAFVKCWGSEDSTRDMTLEQRSKLLCLTARSGNIANLEVALAAMGCPLSTPVFTAAASAGHLEMCVWLLDQGCPRDDGTAIAAAAEAGHVAVVRWILQLSPEPDDRSWLSKSVQVAAAGVGNRSLCEELLVAPEVVRVEPAVCAAAKYGHVDLTSWLLERLVARPGSDIDDSKLLPDAAYGFPLPALQQLYDRRLGNGLAQRREFSEDYGGRMAAAAFISPTPDWRAKLEWLEAVGCSLEEKMADDIDWVPLCKRPDAVEQVALLRERGALDVLCCLRDAIRSANLSVLRYLRHEGLLEGQPRDRRLMCLAAEGGNMTVVEDLQAAGWSIQEDAAFSAVSHCHLHVLQWMQGPEAGPAAVEALQGALQDPRLLMNAAILGSLELVVWLRERGCPWDDDYSFLFAVRSGNVVLLEWMAAQGCPMPIGGKLYLEACRNDDSVALRCLRRLGCPWGPTTFTLAVYQNLRGRCSLAVMRWLVAEGCPVDDWEAVKEQLLGRWDAVEVRAWIESLPQMAAGEDGQ